ncbi:sigma-70 family RNA polymerase sigma factor [Mycobacterium sp. IDR2000157661]|uniref:sigma-70 family RNA polymerase sigma factor n=1 Tax=Mycobacterium sp. IDR2000157661 TaxID=2867005 RepID=UPI001EEA25B1|nr:sigma-70 family RNA polymerase sigma factor [Mycobacterium sp. IDR2000157661]ULE34505.1 sigma-70 family RNA polymerase sigma factor [Mycobacterium sp. IDR2000157661]
MTVALSRPQPPGPVTAQAADRPAAPPPEHEPVETVASERIDIDELFRRMADSSDDVERQRWRRRIITACMPIADRIAWRFVGRGEPPEDLLQVARIGLIHTVDRFDPNRGHFLSLAVPTIRGELKRYFRDNTWTVRVPRRMQETQMRLRDAVNTLSQRLCRAPTNDELARELDVSPEELAESQNANWAYQPLSLDSPVGAAESTTNDTLGSLQGCDDPRLGHVEDLMVVHDALAELDPRRRAVVGMIFFDCLTQREVAQRLNVSQVQISRLLNDTLCRIRQRVCSELPAA